MDAENIATPSPAPIPDDFGRQNEAPAAVWGFRGRDGREGTSRVAMGRDAWAFSVLPTKNVLPLPSSRSGRSRGRQSPRAGRTGTIPAAREAPPSVPVVVGVTGGKSVVEKYHWRPARPPQPDGIVAVPTRCPGSPRWFPKKKVEAPPEQHRSNRVGTKRTHNQQTSTHTTQPNKIPSLRTTTKTRRAESV